MSEIDCLKRCGDEAAIEGLPDLNTQPKLQEIGKNKNLETHHSDPEQHVIMGPILLVLSRDISRVSGIMTCITYLPHNCHYP